MTIEACAELVRRGDEDRFLSAMTARPQDRAALFTLYAFNLEISRAPWVTEEAMIAEMRLQFWRDVVEEAGAGKTRAHEVAAPFTDLIRNKALDPALLDQMITARQWDIYRDPFEDEAHFDRHIDRTSGHLMWLSALALGAPKDAEGAVRNFAYGVGVANWLVAVPALAGRGRIPLLDGRAEAVRALAERALLRLLSAKLPKGPWMAALRSGWMAGVILKQAVRNPERVGDGTLGCSDFRKKLILLRKTLLNAA